jgi:hypothetical protein
MWVAFAGPLTHAPMVGMWLGLQLAATKAAFGNPFLTISVRRGAGGGVRVAGAGPALDGMLGSDELP